MSKGKKAVRSHEVKSSSYALGWASGFQHGKTRNLAVPLGCRVDAKFAEGFAKGFKEGDKLRRREAVKVRSAFKLAQSA